jgi:LEA14-like dessication related protein
MRIYNRDRKQEIIVSLKKFNTLRYEAKKVLNNLPMEMNGDNRQEFVEALQKRVSIYESYIFNIAQLDNPDLRDAILNSGACAKRSMNVCVQLLEKLNNPETQDTDLIGIQAQANMNGLKITHDMVEKIMENYHIKPEEVD